MADAGDAVGGIIGLGVGLIALDMVGHAARRIEDDEDRRPKKKVQPKRQVRREDDDIFPDIF